MRNFIFKNELEYLFHKHHISLDDQVNIRRTLLLNYSLIDRGKVFFLREHAQWSSELVTVTSNTNFLTDLNELVRLEDDLHLPVGLKRKILANEKVAVFVGAGVSKLLNYPLWDELANDAIKYLKEKGAIDQFQVSRILNEVKDPKQKLSILETFFDKKSVLCKLFYEDKLILKNKKAKNNPYQILADPIFNWIKLTSNVDTEFADALLAHERIKGPSPLSDSTVQSNQVPRQLSIDDLIVTAGWNSNNLTTDKIYHLHGCIIDPSNMIFTTLDYVESYYTNNSVLHTFLHEVFKEYTMVFIGYGLEELQILESLISRNPKLKNETHYALFGAYLNEMNFFNIRKEYFKKSMNIELQHYYLDVEYYDRLFKVLETWREEIINARGQNFHNKITFIEQVLGGA